jgi:hypothetical protein
LSKSALLDAKSTNILLSNGDDLPLSSMLTFTLKSPDRFPRNGQIEIETLDGTLRTVLTLAPSGGLLLQDPHTIVATLDPLRSFGPSAFGALRMRAIYPTTSSRRNEHHPQPEPSAVPQSSAEADTTSDDDLSSPASDWLPLVTLVRLPTLTQLQCSPDITQSCTITGYNFFLLQAVSTNPDFSDPVPVPDGYTGTSLTIAHPSAGTVFFKLRDDPSSIDSAVLPLPAPPVTAHAHHASHSTHSDPDASGSGTTAPATAAPSTQTVPASTPPNTTTPAPATPSTPAPTTQPAPTPQKQESPAPLAPSSPANASSSGY